MSNSGKLTEIISNVLKVDASEINDESSPENIRSWDSFNGIMLVTELEKGFNVKFTMDDIIAIKNVQDIKKTLAKHGIDIK